MQIQHEHKGSKESFFINKDHEQLASLVYSIQGNRMIIEHTEVDEKLRGQNVGYELVLHAVEHARQNKLTIVPLCVFANKVIKSHPEMQDVL